MATYHQMCTSSDFHEGEVTEMWIWLLNSICYRG
jgi:hypothetical protein